MHVVIMLFRPAVKCVKKPSST